MCGPGEGDVSARAARDGRERPCWSHGDQGHAEERPTHLNIAV